MSRRNIDITEPKLTIELVPSSAWFSNVRSMVRTSVWEVLKKQTSKLANYKCEVCFGRGRYWATECHEVWQYNDKEHIQTLVRLIALCPMCHKVKHIGLAGIIGGFEEARSHLMKVNQWSLSTANDYINKSFDIFDERSKYEWTMDISYLKQFGIDPTEIKRPLTDIIKLHS